MKKSFAGKQRGRRAQHVHVLVLGEPPPPEIPPPIPNGALWGWQHAAEDWNVTSGGILSMHAMQH
jgi:hypothetical protein